ncbi:ABC-2 type transport system ATP-binding protein [Streptoalloteichus tenebrarius]|uniref:ABC-2 type transport system ATP-binding protein n=1 Tax=Streptoalloteichus tenebrarius (strain ATCC 17920 / DSM 40477 / JCM 4838 / CBS 697.72 / NBRC 16177 / NCIMB 11028 / NRRL B-12390 / A12253. 1 / ISP 5477) TaxID=1933 RepID=A0ABT1HRZ4_STRSD|nr:ATP-binding cassette domain-containing protein [Streptoalloteichus tenebrarius]MCP2258262.1 ABC-2 type transport system ATP-binding protein [Streptoalloteichus tenebrarius]BFF04508.1 ATP-binding cassette domain-containing protein [Streptoalloteichus tenebrarius]
MIDTRGLTRHFRMGGQTVPAVAGIDLHIEPGELVALLGPNGAGKTTLLRMLTTLLPPTSGSATVAGCDIRTDPSGVRARIGYVGQRNSAGENFRVRDELVTQGRAYGMGVAAARERADEVLGQLELDQFALRKPGTLSGGQRRRVDIAMGLVHRPALLFLDEPSTGLDPQSRANIWEHILRLRRELGMTLVLTTHYLEEADRMAERVVVVDHGRVIADGTAERLKSELTGDHITVTTSTEADAAVARGVAERFSGEVEVDGTTVRLRVSPATRVLPEYLRTLEAAGVSAVSADVSQPTLDDVFLALTGRSLRDEQAA